MMKIHAQRISTAEVAVALLFSQNENEKGEGGKYREKDMWLLFSLF